MAGKGRPRKNTTNTTTKKTSNTTIVEKKEDIKEDILIESKEINDVKIETKSQEVSQPKVKEQRNLNELICVKNNTHTKLVYVSKRFAGQEWEWEKFGDENYLELQELLAMRNSYLTYFKECWVMCDRDILEYLGVYKYYENIINMDNFDDIFTKKPDEFRRTLEKLPQSMKNSVVKRARQMIQSGELDSIKIIKIIEEVLKIDLTI
jgi:hypothetical protein